MPLEPRNLPSFMGGEDVNKCLDSIDHSISAKSGEWYVCGMIARIRAIQHRYPEAIEAMLRGRKAATDEHKHRPKEDLLIGIRKGHSKKKPERALAKKLFDEENFAELDRLAKQYVNERKFYWDGFETLDYFSTAIEGESGNTTENYKTWRARFKKWLEKNPSSDMARCSLAQLNIYRAIEIENNENTNDNAHKSLNEEAEKILAGAPEMPDRYPKAYVPALRLAHLKPTDNSLKNTISQAHKKWPNYFCVDTWAFRFLDSTQNPESINFLNERARAIGGKEGDKYYARMVSYEFEYNDTCKCPFGKNPKFDWNKTQSGFAQIFKEFPNQVEARIALMSLADEAGDIDAMKKAFDGYTNNSKNPAKPISQRD